MYAIYRIVDCVPSLIGFASDITEAAIIAENDRKDSMECGEYQITWEEKDSDARTVTAAPAASRHNEPAEA